MVAPLIGLIERAAPRGVALISAERVRLLEWQPRTLEELHIWELSVFSRDWRERKAQRVPDPARGHGVSSSGRERFGDRLSDSRHRFLRECRRLALEVAAERDWLTMLTFGQPPQVEDFHQGSEPAGAPIEIGAELDLVGTPLGEVEAIVEEALERLSAQRAARLANQALEGAEAGRRGTAGAQATMAALEEGRVGHLLLDADLADLVAPGRREPRGSKDGEPVDAEELVRRSLATGARITVVTGEAAERLARFRGVAAILRY